MTEHPDILAAAKAVYDMRMRTAWGVGQTKRPPWDQTPPTFQAEIIAEVKATTKKLITGAVTQSMVGAQSAVFGAEKVYEAMVLQRLKDLGIDP